MGNNKVNPLDRKESLTLSVDAGVKIAFLQKCKELDVDKNIIAESLIKDFI